MSTAASPEPAFIDSVLFPTDFSEGGHDAFVHALAIALVRQADLTLLHVATEFLGEDEWQRFPRVRTTLESWGLLEPGSQRAAVMERLQVGVTKVNQRSLSPLRATLDFLERHPTDLLVLATQGREGLPRWIRPSVAERMARQSRTMTLFVPRGGRGFVSSENGELSLRRILVPVDHEPSAHEALLRACRAGNAFGEAPVEVTLLHVGEAGDFPAIEAPAEPACRFERVSRSGDPVEQIVALARERDSDLIAMATAGHEGILDALRGSVTEQVVRQAPCPLLAVPSI